MSCAPHHDRWAQRAEVERLKQQQRAMWTAALTGAVSGAVSGARGSGPSVRIGDAERDAAVSALGEHYVAGRLTKEELDERADRAWSARTSGDLAPLFRDLPQLVPQAPPRPPRQRRDSRHRSARLSWVLVLLVVLAVISHVPWFAVAFVAFAWWSGLFGVLHRSGRRHR